MPIKGYRDLSSVVNVGVDDTVLARYALADGVTYDRLVAELRVVLAGFNGELARHPLWAGLASFQQEPNVALYNTGTSTYADILTDYTRPEPFHAEAAGHMLPLRPFAAVMGWTWLKLRDMSFAEGQADIRLAVDRIRNTYRRAILARLIVRGDDSGVAKGLGAGGYSPGFATAAGNTNLDFIPPPFGGTNFTDAHEHYVPVAGGWTTGILDDMEAELMEHGHMPPYRLLISSSDVATITGLTGFVYPTTAVIQAGSGTSVAIPDEEPTDDGYRFIGSYKNTRIYVTPGMPQYYGFMYRSYGALSPRNPLRVRTERGSDRPTARVLRQVTGGVSDAERGLDDPLQGMAVFLEFGVGVADRTNGTARFVNNAAWSDGVAI